MQTFNLDTIKIFIIQNIKFYVVMLIITTTASIYYFNSMPQKYNANLTFEMFLNDINKINLDINKQLIEKKFN